MDARLADRIHTIVIGGGERTAAAVRGLIAEAAIALRLAEDAASAARAKALDPSTAPADVPAARAAMDGAAFERDRLAASLEALQGLADELDAAEAEAQRRGAYDAALAERDALAAAVTTDYPILAAQLVAMLQRIVDCDARIEAVNRDLPRDGGWIHRVEDVARGAVDLEPIHRQGVPRLTSMNIYPLPILGASSNRLWPPRDGG